MADPGAQRWDLTAHGLRHRVEVRGSASRTIIWYVDDQLVATKKSSEDAALLQPGDRVEKLRAKGEPALEEQQPDLGAVRVRFSALGRTKRVTWYQAEGPVGATARAVLDRGGIDLDPEPGSPAALREERIRRDPRRYAVQAVAGGLAKVVVPVLLGFLLIQLAGRIPWPAWPQWDLPSVPTPDLPSIPWPDVDLPDWDAPDWVAWLADKAQYVWPVVLAAVLARAEIRRRRQQDALKARLQATGAEDAAARNEPPPEDPGGLPPAAIDITDPPVPARDPTGDEAVRIGRPAGSRTVPLVIIGQESTAAPSPHDRSEHMNQPMPREPHEGIKADAGLESESAERDQSSYVSRAGSSGTVSTGPEPGDEQPSQAVGGGTAGGDPLAGVTASAEDVEEAVSGDTGPEHRGQR